MMKNRINRTFLAALILGLLTIVHFLNSRDILATWDQEVYRGEQILFDGSQFSFPGEKEFRLDQVSYLHLNISEKAREFVSLLPDVTHGELLRRAALLEAKYADYPLLVLHDDGIQRLNRDGSRYSQSRYAIKVLNENALDEANFSFYIEEGVYESRIIMGRSISPDGTVTFLDPADIQYTTPSQGMEHFSGRRNVKIMKTSIPNVKVGSIVDCIWETTDYAPEDKSQWYPRWYFAGENPVYASNVSFIVPEDKQLFIGYNKTDKTRLNAREAVRDGFRYYSFSSGEAAPLHPDPQSPPTEELMPLIVGSFYKDQTYLSSWLSKFFEERMVINDDIREAVKKLFTQKKATTEEEKIAALYRYLQEQIQYLSVKTSISSGMAGHPAVETFNNKYGDCIDKAIIFGAILQDLGIKGYPVIVMTNDEAKPLYSQIGYPYGNHAINEIHLSDGRIIYLDTTSYSYKYPDFRSDDHGVFAWNPLLNTVRTIAYPEPAANTRTYETLIDLFSTGHGYIKQTISYRGESAADVRYYLQRARSYEIEAQFVAIASTIYPGSSLHNFSYLEPADYTQDLYIKLEYNALNVGKLVDKYMIFEVPAAYDFSFTSLPERKDPLKFTTTEGKKHTITIKIPENFELKGIPDEIVIENDFFIFKGNYQIGEKQVVLNTLFERKACEIAPGDYKRFREEILKVDYFIKTPLILVKNQ